MFFVTPEIQKKIASQREQILNALRIAGKYGMFNIDLQELGMHWHTRIRELYRMGYKIECEFIGSGLYKYILIKEPIKAFPLKSEKGIDILVDIINTKYKGKVSIKDLQEIFKSEKLQCNRKVVFNTIKAQA